MTALPPDVADDLRLENARLQAELRAARDRQNASAEILRAIADTHGDAEHALHRIAEATQHFFNAASVTIRIAEGDEWVRTVRVGSSSHLTGAQPASSLATRGANLPGTVYQENRQIHIPDLDNIDPSMANWPATAARAAGIRTLCGTPLRRDSNAIGALIVYRDRLAPFTDDELALQQSFADQAVIAIENARLFNGTQKALARQTATSDILRVISQSPTDVQPVFDAIVLTAARLFRCDRAFIQRCDATGFWTVASAGLQGPLPITQFKKAPIDPDANFPSRAIVAKKTLHLPDWSSIELPEFERHIRELHGTNSALYMPLLRESECIGLLAIIGKQAGMFGESEIALAESFRDQAVIAIENTRLFNETKEALERQTATAEILKVIAGSPDDVQPVFDDIAASAKRLIGGFSAAVFRFFDDTCHLAAFTPTNPAADEVLKTSFPVPFSEFAPLRLALGGETVQFADTETAPEFQKNIARARGFRSVIWTPMMNHGTVIGLITLTRVQTGAFAPHHVQLLQTFADQAVIAIENVRLFNETREALERQTATADILKVIASSPSDVQPVFEAIAASAKRLLGGFTAAVFRLIDETVQLAAFTPTNPLADEALKADFPIPVDGFEPFRMVRPGEPLPIADTEKISYGPMRDIARLHGFRSMLYVPLMNGGVPIGLIAVTRVEPGAFASHHVQLLETFADQAVIAIENARLFNETQEALERQTATADILKVIASSPSDVQPVFDVIVERAVRLCGARMGRVYRYDDGIIHMVAGHGLNTPGLSKVQEVFPRPAADDTTAGLAIRSRQPYFVTDIESDQSAPPLSRQMIEALGTRSQVTVPMLRKGEPIGAITVGWAEPAAYGDQQLLLLQTFADQAVIAIENVRLFNETREALERQTATADVLKVISRSVFDLQTVLDTLVESAYKLCGARLGLLYLRDNEAFECKAIAGEGVAQAAHLFKGRPIRAGRGTAAERVILTGDVQSITDFFDDPDFDPKVRETIRNAADGDSSVGGLRSTLAVPMTRDGIVTGVMVIARSQTGPFPPRQVELLQTFADQAVIAIENARLFDEVQARTRDLTESLQQQTATADVLKVISRSTFDLKAVLDTLIGSAAQLCDANAAHIYLRETEVYKLAACAGFSAEYEEFLKRRAIMPGRDTLIGRTAHEGRIVSIPDALNDPEYQFHDAQRLGGFRTMLGIPMLRDGAPIGVLAMTRSEVRPFTDKQVDLVTTFADQAVIAIENVRLFVEVQERTRELSASLDELRTAQDRLVQTEKLASLGQLTAGIAHEIKNPLNFVNNFSALSAELTDELNDLLKSADLTDRLREEIDELTGTLKDNLQKIVQHGKRADSIVKNMLLHSREGSGEHRPADINALVDESLNLAYHGARAEKPQFNVTLQRDFDDKAGTIEVFPQEITRVLLNLISNGFYAVTKRKNENGGSSFDPVVRATTKNLGDAVEIRIRDNGTGIPDEVREKMFNPFFTTKPAGEGTGLGLSMSHDIIVKQHGGTIDVLTEPGEFTEFTIVLPRTGNVSNKSRG